MHLTRDDRIERLAQKVAEKIMDSPRFKRVLREAVLMVAVSQGELNQLGWVRSFLVAAASEGVKVYLRDGKLCAWPRERMSLELRTAMVAHADAIRRHLEDTEEVDRRLSVALGARAAGANGKAVNGAAG